jgi:hypothetical protein
MLRGPGRDAASARLTNFMPLPRAHPRSNGHILQQQHSNTWHGKQQGNNGNNMATTWQ